MRTRSTTAAPGPMSECHDAPCRPSGGSVSPSDGARVGQGGSEAQTGAQGRWRVGRSLGRTLYRDDELVGLLDSKDVAKHIADVLNHFDVMAGVVAQASRELDEVRHDLAHARFELDIADTAREGLTRLLAEVKRRAPDAVIDAEDAVEGKWT